MSTFAFDVSHFLAGTVVLLSFALLYQDRLSPLINIFMMQSLVLAMSIAWQAQTQNAPHLLITAGIELCFKAVIIPFVLYALIRNLKIHRTVEVVVGIGPTMIAGMALVGLSMALMMRATSGIDGMAREDLAFALSIILLGLLMMVTRRNAVSQVIGFMSIENGLVLAATGAKGMPFVVETCVAFSVLIALIVIGVFLFRIRERFDTVDIAILDHFRGERP
jgi:hydrogenase-4 component E